MANNKTDTLFEKINFNSDCRNVAEYIVKKFADFDLEKAMQIAKYLMIEEKYSREAILNGEADKFLEKRSKIQQIVNNSVRQENENIIEVKLRTKKEKISKKDVQKLAGIMATLILITSVLGVTYTDRMNEALVRNTSQKIDVLASEVVVKDEIAYNYNELTADRIINLCIDNPNLFDVLIYDSYYKINNGHRLDTFTEIWNILQNRLSNDESFEPIYSKISNKTFLSYVLNILMINGKIEQNSKEYQKCIGLISEFALKPSYEDISKENRVVLKEMLQKYQDLGLMLYKESNKTIMNEVNEEMGGRK